MLPRKQKWTASGKYRSNKSQDVKASHVMYCDAGERDDRASGSSPRVWSLDDWRRPTWHGWQVISEGRRVVNSARRMGLLRGRALATLAQARLRLLARWVGAGWLILTCTTAACIGITRLVGTAFQNAVTIWRHFFKLKSHNNQLLVIVMSHA